MSSMLVLCTELRANKRFVLTGGPGVGKTTLIEELKVQGHQIIPEIYAVLYARAVAQNRLDSFFSDPVALYEAILDEQLAGELLLDPQSFAFLDRSTIDILAFAKHFKVPLSPAFLSRAQQAYDLIFFLEPLPKHLYKQCSERKETYEEAQELHALLKNAYNQSGYTKEQLIDVPFGDIQERVDFILKKIVEKFGIDSFQQKDSNLVY